MLPRSLTFLECPTCGLAQTTRRLPREQRQEPMNRSESAAVEGARRFRRFRMAKQVAGAGGHSASVDLPLVVAVLVRVVSEPHSEDAVPLALAG